MDPVYSEELLIELKVRDACPEDEVTPTSSISNTLYYIAEDGLINYEPTWTHTKVDCPITYEVSRIETDGTERALTAEEELVLVHDKSNGWLDLNTSNYELDGQIWTIRLFMRSPISETDKRDGVYLFDIEFRDICWDS